MYPDDLLLDKENVKKVNNENPKLEIPNWKIVFLKWRVFPWLSEEEKVLEKEYNRLLEIRILKNKIRILKAKNNRKVKKLNLEHGKDVKKLESKIKKLKSRN
jgi:hypothetical protein